MGPEDRIVFRFDVECLYTNVSVEELLQIIQQKLSENEILFKMTEIP